MLKYLDISKLIPRFIRANKTKIATNPIAVKTLPLAANEKITKNKKDTP
jgi:hypothetical protein